MNLQQAEQKAKYLTELTTISHVVVKDNKEYDVYQYNLWKGDIIKQYDYEKPIENIEQDTIQTAPELRDTSNKKVLQSNRNRGSKASSKNK